MNDGYLSKSKLHSTLKNFSKIEGLGLEPVMSMHDLLEIIKDMPSEDVVPVIRCFECGWRREEEYKKGFCPNVGTFVDDYFYCADGERKTDNWRPT